MAKFLWCVKLFISVGLLANSIQFMPAPADASENLDRETKDEELLADNSAIATNTDSEMPANSMAQITSVSQLTDIQPTDWVFESLQSLVERYGVIAGYPDGTFRGNRAITRYEFAAGLNAALNRINELIAAGNANLIGKEDLAILQRLQDEFASELAILRGRVDTLEAQTAQLSANSFSTTTKLNAEVITAVTDTFGDRVGGNSDESNTIFGYRTRLNFETSFTGQDLLRTRLEFGDFGSIRDVSGNTSMTRLNFDTNTNNDVIVPHILYRFPVSSDVTFTVGPAGVGYTDITDTLTPPTVADDSQGIPSLFGEYSPLYRRGGGGAAMNWKIVENLNLTLGFLAGRPNIPTDANGLFNGTYNALAQLAYYGDWGAIGVAYSHGYAPQNEVDLTGGTGSFLATQPFGDNIAASHNIFALQGYYRISPRFNVHGWAGYINADAKNSGLSRIADGRGGNFVTNVSVDSNADIWYGALGLTFPDVGGKGNLPGILVGLPPKVTSSDVRQDRDTSYHVEAFYRFQLNDYISMTPGFWVVFNPENDSRNDTQYVGVLRTSFDF